MSRLIDADALIELIDGGFDLDFDEVPETKRELIRMINDQESVDAVEVVHGEWIGYSENDTAPKCSNCRKTRLGSSLEFCRKYVPYCECCGASMDGEVKSDGRD